MLEVGTSAPEFVLPDPDGVMHSLGESGLAYLVMFICNHCPFVVHVRQELTRLGHDYAPQGVTIVAINSNDVITHPADSPEKMKEEAISNDYVFPYLFDENQSKEKQFHQTFPKILQNIEMVPVICVGTRIRSVYHGETRQKVNCP